MNRQDIIVTAAEAQRFVELANHLLRTAPYEHLDLLMPFAKEFQEQSRWLTHNLNRLWQTDRAKVETLSEEDRVAQEQAAKVAASAGLQTPTESEQKVLLPNGEGA